MENRPILLRIYTCPDYENPTLCTGVDNLDHGPVRRRGEILDHMSLSRDIAVLDPGPLKEYPVRPGSSLMFTQGRQVLGNLGMREITPVTFLTVFMHVYAKIIADIVKFAFGILAWLD